MTVRGAELGFLQVDQLEVYGLCSNGIKSLCFLAYIFLYILIDSPATGALSSVFPFPLLWAPNELSGLGAAFAVVSVSNAGLSNPAVVKSSVPLRRIRTALSLLLLTGDGTCVDLESSEC